MARPDAFDDLCREQSADLVHFATLVAGSRQAGQDLAQDALLEMWRRWDRLELADPSAYLHTVVIRRQHRLRQRFWNREVPAADPGRDETTASGDDRVISRQVLVHALATLPARQRETVVLCHVFDHSTADAAEMLKCSPAAIRSLCDRGLRALRAQLTEEDSHA